MYRVEAAVKESFGPVGLKENVSFEKLSELTLEVRKKVEGASEAERRYATSLLQPQRRSTADQMQNAQMVKLYATIQRRGRTCPP